MTFSTDPEWNDSLQGTYLWSNTNFGEAFSQAMTPLTWSVLQFTLADWIFLPGYPTVGNIAGRPYLNISVFATVYKLLGRSQQDLLDYMEATLYLRLPEGTNIPLVEVPARQRLPVLWALAQLRWRQRQGVRRLPAYLRDTPAWFERMRRQLGEISSREGLLHLWQQELRQPVLDGRWTVMGIATASADYTLNLRRALTPLVGEQDAGRLIANLSGKSGLLASLGPLVGLQQVANGLLSRADYLAQYGHRGPHEFELAMPRPAEDPAWLDQQLAACRQSPVDAMAQVQAGQSAFDEAWQRFASRYPAKARPVQRRLQESARRGRLREQARSEYVRQRWLLRLFALRAAQLCGLGEEVFFLRLEELLEVLQGDARALEYIAERRRVYQRWLELPAPPAAILGSFDPLAWAADPQRRTDYYDARQQSLPQPPSARLIHGAPGSAGVVEAKVRLLSSAAQAGELLPGEVLVTAMTDISWTPVFPRAAAVVTDVGAPLSHAAIVARELGIPAVVGCGDATQRLHTGDRVRVDGGSGLVEILSEPGNGA